jgi:large subunit ribosomal protein L15
MKYSDLNLSQAKRGKRVGRGISAGQGKTAGRGTKGQKSRAGSTKRPGFEGGQNPLMQRLPKLRGFSSKIAKAETVYTGELNRLGAKVDNQSLFEAGLITSPFNRVKLVTKGELTKKLTVNLQAASQSAIKAIEKNQGSFKRIPQPMRPAKKTADNK